MEKISIEESVNRLREKGYLDGEVVEMEVEIDKDIYYKFKEFCNKYHYIKEEDIVSCFLLEFIENYRRLG